MTIPHKPGARPVSEILESPFNHRKVFPLVQLWELAESIRANGVEVDCLARPAPKKTKASAEHVELVYGHRRRRAALIAVLIDDLAMTLDRFTALEPAAREKLLAGAAARALLPLDVRDLSDEEALAEQGRENFQRAQPSALEAADYLHTLMRPRPEGLGFTLDQVLAKTNKERPWVVKHLKLLGLSAEVRDVLYAQDLQNVDDYAFELARITDHALQKEAMEQVLSSSRRGGRRHDDDPTTLSVADTRRLIKTRYMLALAKAPFDTAATDLVSDHGACGPCPERTGNQPGLFADVADDSTCTNMLC